jgi:D-alanyl-D-alanine carboxypeptidase
MQHWLQLLSLMALLAPGSPARAERLYNLEDLPESIELGEPEAGDSPDGGNDSIPKENGIRWSMALGLRGHDLLKNSEALMMPASTQKVITAIAALKMLPGGGDFQFENYFQGDFDADTGVLRSPEFLVTGDPTWGHKAYKETLTSRLMELVTELKNRGVKIIVGPITVTNTVPAVADWKRPAEDDRVGPWRKRWRWAKDANAPTPATLQENLADFRITGYQSAEWITPGASGRLEVDLSSHGGPFSKEPIMDDHGRAIGYRLTGGLPRERVFHVHLQDGDNWLKALAAQVFNQDKHLQYTLLAPPPRLGLSRGAFGFSSLLGLKGPPKLSVKMFSKPLREILVEFVQRSINLVGEALYLQLAHHQKTSDVDGLLKGMIKQVTNGQANLDPAGSPEQAPPEVRILDGSGHRLDNQMRASVLRDLLEGVRNDPCFDNFFHSLAEAGVSGTLAGWTGGYQVFGKTGTVDYVKNLVGYYRQPDRDGTLVPFAFLTQTSTPKSEGVTAKIAGKLVQFARQNGGLARSSKSSGSVAKKSPRRRSAKKRSR